MPWKWDWQANSILKLSFWNYELVHHCQEAHCPRHQPEDSYCLCVWHHCLNYKKTYPPSGGIPKRCPSLQADVAPHQDVGCYIYGPLWAESHHRRWPWVHHHTLEGGHPWLDHPGVPRQAKEMNCMFRCVLPASIPLCLQILKSIWKLLLRADDRKILLHQTG